MVQKGPILGGRRPNPTFFTTIMMVLLYKQDDHRKRHCVLPYKLKSVTLFLIDQ